MTFAIVKKFTFLKTRKNTANTVILKKKMIIKHGHSRYRRLQQAKVSKIVGELSNGEPILEVGCGLGRLMEQHENIIGIDILNGGSQNILASSSHLPFKDESFNLAVHENVIEHLNHNEQKATIKEISRILKQNGKLIISTPNKNLYNIAIKLKKLNLRCHVEDHKRELTPRMLKNLLVAFDNDFHRFLLDLIVISTKTGTTTA